MKHIQTVRRRIKHYVHNSTSKNEKTVLPSGIKISGSIVSKNEGWTIINVYGDPFERGFAHGYLLKNDLERVMYLLPFLVKKTLKVGMATYLDTCKKEIFPIVENSFPEFFMELQGICAGAVSKGLKITIEFLIAWNSFLSLYGYFVKNKKHAPKHHVGKKSEHPGHCSAFIATGDATENGEIVMAHSTHCDIVSASLFNIVLYVTPKDGFAFCIQTCAGMIASGSDFFISSSGIIGTETTISYINYKQQFNGNYPYFCRIRKAIQYGKSLEEFS